MPFFSIALLISRSAAQNSFPTKIQKARVPLREKRLVPCSGSFTSLLNTTAHGAANANLERLPLGFSRSSTTRKWTYFLAMGNTTLKWAWSERLHSTMSCAQPWSCVFSSGVMSLERPVPLAGRLRMFQTIASSTRRQDAAYHGVVCRKTRRHLSEDRTLQIRLRCGLSAGAGCSRPRRRLPADRMLQTRAHREIICPDGPWAASLVVDCVLILWWHQATSPMTSDRVQKLEL